MKPLFKKTILILIFQYLTGNCFSQVDSIFDACPLVKGDYFSETKPGKHPEVFAPYLLNSKIHHLHSAPVFTTDGKEMFFSAYVNNEKPQRIFHAKKSGKVEDFERRYEELKNDIFNTIKSDIEILARFET